MTDLATTTQPPVDSARPLSANLAVFIDFENLVVPYAATVGPLLASWRSSHRLLLARAYADWGKLQAEKRLLAERGVELCELPFRRKGRNSADLQLTVDALEVAFHSPEIDTIAIISGDRDFVPLARTLRKWGRQVWGYGCPGSTSQLLRAVCDRFELLEYEPEQGIRTESEPGEAPDVRAPVVPTELEVVSRALNRSVHVPGGPRHCLSRQVQELVRWALAALAEAAPMLPDELRPTTSDPADGNWYRLSHLFQMMRLLDPSFSLDGYYVSRSRRQIRFAQRLQLAGLVVLKLENPRGSCWLVRSALESSPAGQPAQPPDDYQAQIDQWVEDRLLSARHRRLVVPMVSANPWTIANQHEPTSESASSDQPCQPSPRPR